MINERPLILSLATGLMLWLFVLLIPALHLELSWSPAFILLSMVPILILCGAWILNSRDAYVAAFIPSLLPPLLLHPELAGPRIYGVGALTAVTLATVLHIVVSWRNHTATNIAGSPNKKLEWHGARLLNTHAVLFFLLFVGMAYLAYFHQPFRETLSRNYGDNYSLATVVIGSVTFTAWLVAASSSLIANFGKWVVSPQARTAEWFRFEVDCTEVTRVRLSLSWSLLVGGLSGVIFWSLVWLGG